MDIDRCVLDPSERIGHYLSGDISTYESLWSTDKVIPQGYHVYSQFLLDPTRSWRCLFITSRREHARSTTLLQLRNLWPDAKFDLLMRPGDVTKEMKDDGEIKPWLLEQNGYSLDDVFIAFDDRQAVVDAWRRLGIVCYQTAADVGT